ncbi:hypothetical protein ANN_00986 [Periplaneta americana]|uniref:Uncharacterized protein n=1 Tax=Periplaneta americana TaxID=6978 RepID=A0ABQ8TUR2_PERAM|nr:hypothetical protein ANN_00986 [Periplaneta americana]
MQAGIADTNDLPVCSASLRLLQSEVGEVTHCQTYPCSGLQLKMVLEVRNVALIINSLRKCNYVSPNLFEICISIVLVRGLALCELNDHYHHYHCSFIIIIIIIIIIIMS